MFKKLLRKLGLSPKDAAIADAVVQEGVGKLGKAALKKAPKILGKVL
jgi:hypothetical protein